LTDGEMVEDDDEIEIRAVISGGSGGHSRISPARAAAITIGKLEVPEHGRRSRPRGRASEHGRGALARTATLTIGKSEVWEHGRRSRPRGRPSEHGRVAAARTGPKWGFARANPLSP
jgi:hypothetical protein